MGGRAIATWTRLPALAGRLVTFDIGGGSTEYILAEPARILAAVSLRLGVVPLAERFPFADGVDRDRYAVLLAEELCRRFQLEHVFDRLCSKRRPVLHRLPSLVDAYEATSFAAHRASPFAIELAHKISDVMITGALEPTYSSCASREQITPG